MNGPDNPIVALPLQPDVNVGPTTACGGKGRKRPSHCLPVHLCATTRITPSEQWPNRSAKDSKCNRSAYTLLEVILALALTIVILGLIGMAMHIHLGVADKSRGQVEEAQLARTLLQHIADDIRNSVPFTPTSSSGTSSGGTSNGVGIRIVDILRHVRFVGIAVGIRVVNDG